MVPSLSLRQSDEKVPDFNAFRTFTLTFHSIKHYFTLLFFVFRALCCFFEFPNYAWSWTGQIWKSGEMNMRGGLGRVERGKWRLGREERLKWRLGRVERGKWRLGREERRIFAKMSRAKANASSPCQGSRCYLWGNNVKLICWKPTIDTNAISDVWQGLKRCWGVKMSGRTRAVRKFQNKVRSTFDQVTTIKVSSLAIRWPMWWPNLKLLPEVGPPLILATRWGHL